MKRAKVLGVAGLALALGLATACSSSSGGSSAGGAGSASGATQKYASGGTFTFAVSADPGTLNPLNNTATTANWLFRFLYQPLVTVNANGTVAPGLASSWTFNGTKATFTIDKDATCSDGSKITPSVIAEDFAWVKNKANASSVIGAVLPNANFTDTADDATDTFTLTLASPFSNLLPSLSFMPIPCGAGAANPASLTTTSSGSGPFVLTSAVPNSQYVMKERPGFAGNSAQGVPSQVVMKIVNSESTAANLLLSGQINAAVINGPDRTRVTAAGATQATSVSGGVVLSFNEAPGQVTADKAVRIALTEALDRDQAADVVTQGLLPKAGTSVSAAQPQICDDATAAASIPAYSAKQADATLAADGWTKGAGGVMTKGGTKLAFNLDYSTATPGAAAAVQLMASEFQAIGAQATITPLDQADYTERVFASGNYNVVLEQFSNPFPSTLAGLLAGPVPPNGTNAGHVSNSAYNSALASAQAASSNAAACPDWIAASKALFSNADMIPISGWPTNWVTKGAAMSTVGGRPVADSIRMLAS
jgi:peptide/nickel transport system substrate-binding protein